MTNEHIKMLKTFTTSHGDDCTADLLLDYTYFRGNYNLIAIGLASNKNWMLIQGDTRNYSKENQECAGNTKVFFIVKEVKNIGFLTMDC